MIDSINRSDDGLDRRSLLKTGLGVAGGLLLPRLASAADYPALANFPAGVSGDSVFVGLTLDLTGPYSAEGAEEQKGYELAIEQINAGDPAVRKISPVLKKGVLGKKIVSGAADVHSNPDASVQAATRFIHENKAMLITGSTSSAVAVALEKVCDREKTIYMAAISGSNDTTGKDCQRYGFRLCYYAYPAAKAIAPVLAKELGKTRKAVYMVPDYTYGHTTYDSMVEFTGKEGWKTVGQQVHPLGTKDYSSYLINIANSGADTLVVIDYGLDAVNSIKQAKQFGVLDKMALVVPYMAPFLGEEVGPEIMQGVIGATGFWWTLEDKYPVAKDFVAAFEKKYSAKPHDSAYIAYLTLVMWADGVERAGTFYAPEVIKSLEKEVKREGPVGPVWFRGVDHQGMVNFPIVRGKKPAAMKNKSDLFDILTVAEGSSVVAPPDTFGCKLGAYV